MRRLRQFPDKARKLYERGLEEARAENPAKAANTLKEAVTLHPNFPLALNELGVQYLKLRQINKAIDVLREACKLNPDAVPARLNLGIALLESKQFAHAEEHLREAVKQNNNSATAHMYFGIALLRQNKFDEAEKELLVATQANAAQLGMANYYLGGSIGERRTILALSSSWKNTCRIRRTLLTPSACVQRLKIFAVESLRNI